MESSDGTIFLLAIVAAFCFLAVKCRREGLSAGYAVIGIFGVLALIVLIAGFPYSLLLLPVVIWAASAMMSRLPPESPRIADEQTEAPRQLPPAQPHQRTLGSHRIGRGLE